MSKSRTPERGGVDMRQALQQLEKRLRTVESATEEAGTYIFGSFQGRAGFGDLLSLTGVVVGGKGSQVRYPTLAGLGT